MNQPGDYRKKFVAFVDILGFKELVIAAEREPQLLDFIAIIMGKLRRTCCENPYHGGRITQFSDCIVMSYNATEDGLSFLMMNCTLLTTNLIQHGILLRGGISVGNLCHDDELLFGIGMNRAYAFDSSGQPPRISIDQLVLDELPATSRCRKFIASDEDGSAMCHTLIDFEFYDPTNPKPGMVCWDKPAERISAWISAQASDDRQPDSIRRKYEWLRRYWNRSVKKHGVLPAA